MQVGFIRKVYSILSAQLLFTAAVCSYFCFSPAPSLWVRNNPWVLILSLIISIACMYALGCYRSISRSVPLNYILLFLFTSCESLLVGCICSVYDRQTVFMAAVLTAAVVVALTLYAYNTKTDFTMCGGLLFVLGMVFLVASILAIFIRNRWLQLALSVFGVILFSMYLVYDTQLIMGNHSNSLSIDEYIWAAMMLYVDIIQIFLQILKLLGEATK